jgi:uncharacterized protein
MTGTPSRSAKSSPRIFNRRPLASGRPRNTLEAVTDSSNAPFSPARFLSNRHAQTIWPALLRRRKRPVLTSEIWEAPDGEGLDVDCLPDRPGRPALVVLHGLEGSSRAPYVGGLLAAIDRLGWNGLALNFRSCGPSGERGARLYHSGDTRDLQFIVDRARQRWPGVPLMAVGFSMGGNALLKWLGEQGETAPVHAAIAVSVPFDLAVCAAALDAPGLWPAIYRRRFLRSLRRKALRIATERPDLLDAEAIRRSRTFAEFDDRVTAPLNGYADAHDYWARCSSSGFLARIRRPTLLVSSHDDPFVPAAAIPLGEIAGNPFLTTRFSERGGHVGFVAGSPWRPRYELEAVVLEFLSGVLSVPGQPG